MNGMDLGKDTMPKIMLAAQRLSGKVDHNNSVAAKLAQHARTPDFLL